MPRLEVADLPVEQLPLAWPLVRPSMPELQADGWQAFAKDILDRGGGIIGITAQSRALQGVAAYESVTKPHFGKVLLVSTLATFELSGRSPVRRRLMTALNLRAQALGCSSLMVASPGRGRWQRTQARAPH